jgi:hypothetical protein
MLPLPLQLAALAAVFRFTSALPGGPDHQILLDANVNSALQPLPSQNGTGHFSDWSRQTKLEFLQALSSNQANDWVLVMGNEAGGAPSE